MNELIKVAALAAVLSASAVFAQDPSTQPAAQGSAQSVDYTKLDANADGSISKDEAKMDPTLSAKFSELDKDKNGTLSSTELSASKDK